MRKIFLLLSVILLFLGAMANAPPVVDISDSQKETIKNSLEQPADAVSFAAIEHTEVMLPLMFVMPGLLEMPILMVEYSTLDVNLYENTSIYATQGNLCLSNNLFWCENENVSQHLDYRLTLATNKYYLDTEGLSRLDIGEKSSQPS